MSTKENNSDLTRIEDLSDFIHEEDEDQGEESSLSADETSPNHFVDDAFSEEEPQEEFQEETSFDMEDFHMPEEEESFSEPEAEAEFESFDEEASNTTIDEEETTANPDPLPSTPPASPLQEVAQELNNNFVPDMSIEGNPPYSLVISNVRYLEDAQTIVEVLKQYQLISESSEAMQSLKRGRLLIPRISEYVAIALVHKLRHMDLDLDLGLSKVIQSSSTFEETDKGLLSKSSLQANKHQSWTIPEGEDGSFTVLATTASEFPHYRTIQSLRIATKVKVIDKNRSTEQLELVIDQAVGELTEALKETARQENCNGVVGIQSAVSQDEETVVICTGTLVRIQAL